MRSNFTAGESTSNVWLCFFTKKARFAAMLAVVVPFWTADALAIESDEALTTASQQVTSVTGGVGNIRQALQKSLAAKTPAQQIADAVLLIGAKDYDRAATVLNEVIEKHADNPTAYPDALALLGEVYFRSKQTVVGAPRLPEGRRRQRRSALLALPLQGARAPRRHRAAQARRGAARRDLRLDRQGPDLGDQRCWRTRAARRCSPRRTTRPPRSALVGDRRQERVRAPGALPARPDRGEGGDARRR